MYQYTDVNCYTSDWRKLFLFIVERMLVALCFDRWTFTKIVARVYPGIHYLRVSTDAWWRCCSFFTDNIWFKNTKSNEVYYNVDWQFNLIDTFVLDCTFYLFQIVRTRVCYRNWTMVIIRVQHWCRVSQWADLRAYDQCLCWLHLSYYCWIGYRKLKQSSNWFTNMYPYLI